MAFEFEAHKLKHKNIIFICSTNFHLIKNNSTKETIMNIACLLYTSDAADE